MQLASTSTPRSASNSATCSYDSGYRRYQRTHKMITSPGCWRPLKGLFGVIGIGLLPYQFVGPEVRNGTTTAMEIALYHNLGLGTRITPQILLRKVRNKSARPYAQPGPKRGGGVPLSPEL